MESALLNAIDESQITSRIDWTRIGVVAVFLGLPTVTVAGLIAGVSWMPLFPKELGRSLTEGFLRAFLVGYAVAVFLSLIALIAFIWIMATNQRRLFRKRWVPRVLLAGLALLASLSFAETAAWTWHSWLHRMPSLPTRFPESTSTGDELSIVVIGGSAAMGYPYKSELSIGGIVGSQLERYFPGKKVRVNILAKMGANLERMHQELAGLKRKPDAIIINSGNNEFLSRFEPQRNAGMTEVPLNPFLVPLYSVSLRSPLCRLVYETISKHRLGGKPTPVNHPKLIDPDVFTHSEFLSVLEDFQRRLDAIVDYCDRVGAVPILVIPACNLSGYEPNRNHLPDRVPQQERDKVEELFVKTRQLEGHNASQALLGYRAIIDQWPELAEAHFRLARLLEAAGSWKEAKTHYHAAKERDAFPIRELDVFQEHYRRVAKRSGCILVDGPHLFEAVAPHGIVGDDYFHDAHHPTLRGNMMLAQAVVSAIHERKALNWPKDSPALEAINLKHCLTNSPMNTNAWNTVCTCTATFYRDLANIRFDPTERRARQAVYEAAMKRLQEGIPPEQLGIPGMGLLEPGTVAPGWWQQTD